MDRELTSQLDRVAHRLRTFRFWSGMGIVWVLAAIFIGVVYAISQVTGNILDGTLIVAATIGVIGSLLVTWGSSRSARNVHQVANLVESRYPQLDSALLTAVEQQPDGITGRFGYLQSEVVGQAIRHGRSHNWQNVVTQGQLYGARLTACVGLVATLLAAIALGQLNRDLLASGAPVGSDSPDAVAAETVFEVEVEPGDTEVERGSGLLVLAKFLQTLPSEATLVYTSEDGNEHALPMSRSLDDPLFGSRIPVVSQALSYHVEFEGQKTRDFQVEVFEYPLLLQTDARLVFPSYTGHEDKFVPDVRRVSAVEGTKLTLLCRVNKPLATAEFIEQKDSGDEALSLQPEASDPLTYSTTFVVDRSRELTLHLTDDDQRVNQHPPKLQITMIANLPPDIKLATPTKDIEVSPIEEVDLAASAWDDFGLKRVGINYSIPGKVDQDVSLGDSFPSKERVELGHLLAFESLDAQPDQLLSWYFWAEDIGPDGQLRRTMSDMFFAEVRPFEQIFRQGEQPPQGSQQHQQQQGGQNAEQAQKLAELQKQIISATWKIIRRETHNQPTDQFDSDTQLLIESQESAMVQLEELQGNLQDVTSIEHAAQVRNSMERAVEALSSAVEESSPAKMSEALQAEQAAYQGLLRLRAREHEVIQSSQSQQSGQSQQSQNSRAQQQLQQLQLQEDENRYAQEQQAQTEQQQQAREDRQILNRLRELAQRQEDLNERIQELQAALEAAENDEQRAEAQQQLKRLREEQEQILRDTEELQQRMEQPENQERMAEQRQQLEQARENIQRSSEAIEQQMVTQAANEGTRAQRELNELREEFQRKTSREFEEELRDMKNQAQDLVEAEEELARQLEDLLDEKPEQTNSLRESNDQEELGGQIAEQQERLDQLLQRMRDTVEQAEQSQPLLAEKLYESIRETRTSKPNDALKETEMLLDRGFVDQAARREQQAREGIEQLAEGIEQAADQVLGDETEMLRRALDELEQLNEDLEGELARNGQQQPGQQQPGQQQPGQQQPGQQQPGQQQPGQQQPGQQQPGQQQPGQQQPGQQQPGQQQPGQQQPGQQQPGQQQPGQQQPGQQPGQQQSSPGSQAGSGALDRFLGGGGNRNTSPFSGDDFVDWSDRLRDVEEIVNDPELRAEAARIRDEARELRREQIETSAPPQWDIIQQRVARPLAQLQNRVAEELLRRTSEEARVPLDKDPVPAQYEDAVRRYYERLGSSE
ncbi:hypothetical protein [Bremerella sp. P1]|uniref:hypothetical protein n=1 Tax=Bremerella sp. P1 TaxID=3026424 RepID=UPI00236760B4|nr:hypothetical protein [Bremerella sp. P1]WDI41771.1 hypothetical protein PSR63_25265 [Bremerella sp. P1]